LTKTPKAAAALLQYKAHEKQTNNNPAKELRVGLEICLLSLRPDIRYVRVGPEKSFDS
jgi:hypothetical protein